MFVSMNLQVIFPYYYACMNVGLNEFITWNFNNKVYEDK